VELQGQVDALRTQGIGLATISYDSREAIAGFIKQHGITFTMLSDPGSATIKRYGILNTVVAEAFGPNKDDPAVQADVRKYISIVGIQERMDGIAFPGTFMLDTSGRVTSRFFEDFYIERNTVASVLKRLGVGGATVAGTRVSTPQLDVTTYPSNPAVAVGNRFSLVFEVTPKPGMHVYAPGATSYRIIKATIAEQPYVRALPLTYPASEIYHFVPLDERVPVYMKPFTLVQEVVVDGSLEAQKVLRGQETLVVNGTLEYQACDDKLCYNPVSVPLTWTLQLRPVVFR
jgi:peroxiredoxin